MNIDSDFTIVELEQGSPEWHAWRSDGIGATNAKVAMGKHGKGFDKLLRVKAEARTKYISRTGTIVKPVCVQSTKYKWLRASLDGLTEDHSAAVEIKCGARVYEIADETASIPDYYYPQTQHILAVTGLWSLDFWCHWPGSPDLLVNVPRNDDYIKNLLEKEEAFWNMVLDLRKV